MTAENRAKVEWLNRYRKLDLEIDRNCAELSRWRSIAERITPTLSLAPGGGNGDRIPDAMEHIIELQQEINSETDEFIETRRQIKNAINGISDITLRTLMKLRYIDGERWEQIAIDMNYDYRWVMRLHGRALQMIKTP